ncbi:MAG: hypothetical protein A2Z14_10600 [Chloroflexi bacterium RBG_16_48_8]|nr:MAG: hypothetical protein A2Z14_10600 [Chloroflexi bacterium RBG_16_48_8]
MSNGWKIGAIIAIAIVLLASGVALGMVFNFGRFQALNLPGSHFLYGMSDWMHGFGGFRGMMGRSWPNIRPLPQNGDLLSLDEAVEIAESYIEDDWGSSLEIVELMQFDNHFYAQAIESDAGINAFEFLIDPVTAAIHPEPGPNMMWNTKYGMMGGKGMMGGFISVPADELSISPEHARELAQRELDRSIPGSSVDEEVDVFYGY